MRKKLRDQSGVSLVEMLCATIILVLLGLLLNTGLQLAVKSYREIIAESETQLLLSTAIDTLADDLRYARDVETEEGTNSLKSYRSDSYGTNAAISVVDGQLMAGPPADSTKQKKVLPSAAYGKSGGGLADYELSDLSITYQNRQFVIKLKVTAKGLTHITAQTPEAGVTVRCLNPEQPAKGEGETP